MPDFRSLSHCLVNIGITARHWNLVADQLAAKVRCSRFVQPARVKTRRNGGLAQLVERVLCKHEVSGSNPLSSTSP